MSRKALWSSHWDGGTVTGVSELALSTGSLVKARWPPSFTRSGPGPLGWGKGSSGVEVPAKRCLRMSPVSARWQLLRAGKREAGTTVVPRGFLQPG